MVTKNKCTDSESLKKTIKAACLLPGSILADNQGYGDMSCTGNPVIRPPQMDRLYDEGVRLADFHVDPTCSPTRATFYDRRCPARTGIWLTYIQQNRAIDAVVSQL